MTTLEAAIAYTRLGVRVVPVPHAKKGPALDGWQTLRLTESDLPRYFNGKSQNIGALNGTPSGDLVDADIDAPEALELAGWLPPTGRTSGRPSKPESHHWYRAAGLETVQFRDVDGAMLVELRSTGSQTLVPPSTHPSGELIAWGKEGKAARIDAATLRAVVSRIAAGALLARHWPAKGSRHDAALALAGVLLRGGWSADEVATFIREVARVAGDEEARERAAAVRTTARRLANEGKATGLPTLANLLSDGAAVVDKLREWLGLAGRARYEFDEFDEFPRAGAGTNSSDSSDSYADRWPVLRDDALHGLAGAIVRAIAPQTEADPAALLVGFLVSFGNVVGRGPHAWADGGRHGLNEFAVVVGDTAKARKDTARNRIRPLFAALDPDWATGRQGSGLSSGEGFIHAVRDPVYKQEKNRATGEYEQVQVDPGVADKRLLVDESEFATVLKVIGRESNTLSDNVRKAWDGGVLRSMTRNSPLAATDPHISIIANITREEFRRLLTETEAANGFLNRFTIVCAKRSQLLPDGGGVVDLAPQVEQLRHAVAWARTARTFRRDARASALWGRVYRKLAAPASGLYGALTARAEAHILRLSCLYAALDRCPQVEDAHLRAAVALWRYCEESTRYLFGDATGDYLADRILDTLAANPEGLSQSDLHRFCGNNVSAARLDAALGTLLAAGRVVRDTQPGEGTKPVRWWRALPPTRHRDDWDAALAADTGYEFHEFDEVVPPTAGGNSCNSSNSYPDGDAEREVWEP